MESKQPTIPSGVSRAFEVFGREAGAHAAGWMVATRALEEASALDPKTKDLTWLSWPRYDWRRESGSTSSSRSSMARVAPR